MTPKTASRITAKHKNAIAALKRAACKLVDMQFDAERASWEGKDNDANRSMTVDCSMVISDLAMAHAVSFTSTVPTHFEVRQIHKDSLAERKTNNG